MGAIFRADVVGSMLRPQELVQAKRNLRAGELAPEDYARIEDRAVDEALRIQERAGMEVVTDGEMRRDIFFDFFIRGLSGLSPLPGSTVRFHGHEGGVAMEVQIPFSVTERIATRECPGVAEYTYAVQHTRKPVKITLPSPGMIVGFWNRHSAVAYSDPFSLMEDAADAVATWMRQVAAAGCTYIQIDAPELNEVYVDPRQRAEYESRGIPVDRFLALDTEIVTSLGNIRVPGVTKGLHVCKGNGTQSWIAEGGYEQTAQSLLSRATGFDVIHMEYDDLRSGSFEPLRHIAEEQVVVLGLVSTKWVRMETAEELKARVREASAFHPLASLALSTQCGFASASETAEDRRITENVQAAKLKLIADVAREIWHTR